MMKLKFLLGFILISTYPIKAIDNEIFSKLICELLTISRNVKESDYNEFTKIVSYRTNNGKESKILCLWYPKNEDKQIKFDQSDCLRKNDVDFIFIGYGQTSSNPAFYYYIPVKKVRCKMQIKQIEKYQLDYPIIHYNF